MSHGSLRDEVIYPDNRDSMHGKGWTDERLLELLDIVSLGHIVTREGGWDSRKDWKVKYRD